uniref:Envelopment polyprotein n=1 Tax=Maguari virus TaxID=11575 RepID=Q6WGL5_MAGV|nr:glycoprotein precursor [Maguari virus]
MELLIIILLLGSAASSPISTRCFHGGQLIAESKSATSISEFCLKDDVSMIKSEVTYIKNDTGIYGHNKVFRSWTIKDWKLCNPIPTAGGSINVIEVNSDLSLATRAYVCSRDCTITIDKEDAQIIFQTDKLNHFEVSGTTLSSGWFKTKASVTLDRTCEHIKVTCGKKSLQFHACFKHHMSCIRFFHHTILPGTMVSSMCQNIELIIIIGLTLVIFILMVILTKTYICYLLMPVFMPVAYIYGWAYNKSCKKCNCCGLAYHPFTNCGSHCVCGLKFEASDRMRLHRESGLCQGYKSLRIARMLCKSKGSSLVISGLLSMLLLSFITPIEGTLTNYPNEKQYTLEEIADVVEGIITEQHLKEYVVFYTSLFGGLILLLTLILSITINKVTDLLASTNVIYCEECSMYHSKKGIKYNGDFTNKCGFCTCSEQEDVEGVIIHKVSRKCTYKYQLKWVRVIMIILALLLTIQNTVLIVAAEVQQVLSRSQTGRQESLSSATPGTATKECSNAKDIGCISPRFGIPIGNLTACGDSPNYKVYKTPEKIYKSNNRGEVWCSDDVHCLTDFEPAEEEVVNRIKQMTCFLTDVTTKTDVFSVAISTCKMVDKGVCTVNDAKWNILKCNSGLYYFTDHRDGKDTGNDFGEYCISHSCNTERFPINPDVLKDCIWEYHSRKSKYISTVSLESLDEFRRAMSDKLSHTLMIYNFKPTANLPHIKPTYKFITANGIENSDGIDSAYILSSIPALGGMSVGYNIQTKDNFPLLDIIVFIKSAIIKTTYNHIYDTGPTIGINTQHDEHCTGPCPTLILHKENWLTFSQERTSRWGCEEFGCLAINTGCVFGSCQDIIHPEAKVYRKAIEEEVVLTVCITFPGNTYCTEINAIEPKITDEIELQFKTVDTKTLPNLLMVQNHKLYSGQIDDLGSFSQGCGNVQKTNQSVIGAGTAKFDYVCHGASRKDVIVRRCYNNNYESCKLLKEETSLIFADNHETLEVANTKHLIGELQFKIMLGDIRYKSFAESPELEVDAKCVGCPSCFESYSCNFQIVTNIDTVCSVDGPCTLFHNRLIISATKQSYGFKMSCPRKPEPTEEFQICNRKYNVLFTTIDKNDKIEINTGDQTSYIYEKDNRCKTWLCRVRDEGISVIFEPLKAFFGSYFSIIFYVVVGIIVLFLTIYIFLPMFFKLRDILKRNEYLYLQELKHK